jgi:hypothetical protein
MKKRILIYLQRDWGVNVGHRLAINFNQKLNFSVGALVSKKATYENLKIHSGTLYDYFLFIDEIVQDPKSFMPEYTVSLKQICDDLGILTIWDLVQSLRNHVKTYSEKFYYSFKQNISDESIIDLVIALYKLCKNIELNFNPNFLILPNFVSLQHIFLSLYFNKKNCKVLSFTGTGSNNLGVFCNNYNETESSFIDKYNELKFSKNLYLNHYFNPAKLLYLNFIDELKKKKIIIVYNFKKEFFNLIKKIFYSFNKKNFLSKVGANIDYIPLRIVFRDYYAKLFNIYYIKKINFPKINEFENFVYLPLQFQPESNIDVLCPFFNNQIETARKIAMKLPYNFTLIVKDHPAMYGLRAKSYLEKIIRTPNVKLINYRISNYDILSKAKILIGFSGASTFLEAAVMKVPAIQLGVSGITSILPNVFSFNDLYNLDKKIIEILKNNIFDEKYEDKIIAYFAAELETGYDEKNFANLWRWKGGNIDKLYNEILKELKIKE